MKTFEQQTVSFCCAYKGLLLRHLQTLEVSKSDCSVTSSTQDDSIKALNQAALLPTPAILHEISELVTQIYALSGKLDFGLEIGRSLHPSDYGTLGFTLMNSPRIIDALGFATKYKHFVIDGFYAKIRQENKLMTYEIDNHYQHTFLEPVIELDFSSMIKFGRFLAGPDSTHPLKIEYVHFMHAPHCAVSTYEDFFGCEVHFNQKVNKMAAYREAIEVPVYGANAAIFGLLEQQFDFIERRSRRSTKLSERVEEYIHANLGRNPIDLVSVAQHFNMSISTFKKRLQQENICFQHISDNVRMAEACRQLSSSHVPIKQIGYALGFSSASAFNKAFRRWKALSPIEYRRQSVLKTAGF